MEDEIKTWFDKNQILFALFYNIGAILIIILIHTLSPTNMAGFGLDLPAFFIACICSALLVLRNLGLMRKGSLNYIAAFIYLLGLACLIDLLFLPANSWKF